jgi:hypothetical protein
VSESEIWTLDARRFCLLTLEVDLKTAELHRVVRQSLVICLVELVSMPKWSDKFLVRLLHFGGGQYLHFTGMEFRAGHDYREIAFLLLLFREQTFLSPRLRTLYTDFG